MLGADDFAGDLAAAVDDVGLREKGGAVGKGDGGDTFLGRRVAIGGKRDALVDQEFGEGVGIFVGGHANDQAVAGRDVLVEAIERRGFFDAGRAPAGPEIEDHHFSAQVRQMDGLTGEVQSEIVGGLSGDGRFALAITGHGENHDQREAEG